MAETKTKSKRIKRIKTPAVTPESIASAEPPSVERVLLRRGRSTIRTIITDRTNDTITVEPILSVGEVYSASVGDETRDYRAVERHVLQEL